MWSTARERLLYHLQAMADAGRGRRRLHAENDDDGCMGSEWICLSFIRYYETVVT